jgi:hypothetical protein
MSSSFDYIEDCFDEEDLELFDSFYEVGES